jgi:hypothetical protein
VRVCVCVCVCARVCAVDSRATVYMVIYILFVSFSGGEERDCLKCGK